MLLGGTARAEEPAKPVASYADSIRCQAFYVVYASLLERGSDEYRIAANVFDEWYDFTAAQYPDGAGKNDDVDLQDEIARIDDELGKAADERGRQVELGHVEHDLDPARLRARRAVGQVRVERDDRPHEAQREQE